jgi:hypothetical protein
MLRLQELSGKAIRYDQLGSQIKELEGPRKALSEELKAAAVELGAADPTKKGCFALELPGNITVTSTTPVKKVIDQEKALALLKERNLLERCTMRVLDEKALEVCFQEGLIDIEDINSFTVDEPQTPRIGVSIGR